MALTLANTLVNPQDLTQITRHTLSLIDGGIQWVNWAMNNTLQDYSFPDETTFVRAIQEGLHGTSLAYLPRSQAFISPVKLMTMSVDELKRLREWESGVNGVAKDTVDDILAIHGVITCANMGSMVAYMQEIGLESPPIFKNMSPVEYAVFEQWINGLKLQDDASKVLSKEAVQFALRQARQPYDFIDYYHIYIVLAKREPTGREQSTDQRMTSSEEALHALLPELFAFLDCPQTPSLPSPNGVLAVVKDWVGNGKSLGFTRISSGARQIVETPSFCTDPATMAASVKNYMAAANQFIMRQEQLISVMKQDGCTCCYRAEGSGSSVELNLNANYVISLQSFQSIPTSTTPDEEP